MALATKAITIASQATSAADIETLSRARKNLAPAQQAPAQQTNVTVNQQQAQSTAMSPRDALAEIVRQSAEVIEDGGQ